MVWVSKGINTFLLRERKLDLFPSETGYLKRENFGQNLNGKRNVVEALWKKKLRRGVLYVVGAG